MKLFYELCLKIVGSHEIQNIHTNVSAILLNIPLNHKQHFRLNKINKIKDYCEAEIKERELMNKRLSKYIASLTTLISD